MECSVQMQIEEEDKHFWRQPHPLPFFCSVQLQLQLQSIPIHPVTFGVAACHHTCSFLPSFEIQIQTNGLFLLFLQKLWSVRCLFLLFSLSLSPIFFSLICFSLFFSLIAPKYFVMILSHMPQYAFSKMQVRRNYQSD